MTVIVDACQNIAPNALRHGHDYSRWAWLQRPHDAPPAMTSLPDSRLARVAVVFASVRVMTDHPRRMPELAEAQAQARWQLDHYLRLADEKDSIRLIQAETDLDEVLETWQAKNDIGGRIQGIVPSMQGAAAVSEPKQVEDWLEHGARIFALAGDRNRYVNSEDDGGDLALAGYDLLEALAGHGALLDIAGLPERAAAHALERYEGAIIASHAGLRRNHDDRRCLPDSLIRQLAERSGVMGLMLYNPYLRRDWHHSDPRRRVTMAHWVDAVDHVCQLTGSAAHVGIGSDIDGGYAMRSLPAEIDTSCELWLLRGVLLARGFGEDDTEAILAGNMLRVLRESLAES